MTEEVKRYRNQILFLREIVEHLSVTLNAAKESLFAVQEEQIYGTQDSHSYEHFDLTDIVIAKAIEIAEILKKYGMIPNN